MKRFFFLFFAAGLASALPQARASETETYCALAGAQARVQSALLKSPEVFGNLGDPTTSARALTLGVRTSLSRVSQGAIVEEIARSQCDAYASQRQLAEQISGIEDRAELKAMNLKRPYLVDALAKARTNADFEHALLAVQNATIANVRTASELRDRLRTEIAALDSRRSRIEAMLPAAQEPLEELVNRSTAAQARVAELTARLGAQAGWDLVIAAGGRRDFSSNAQSGFVAVTASRSFGHASSQDAARQVGELAARHLSEQRDGAYGQLARARRSVAGIFSAQQQLLEGLKERRAALAEVGGKVSGLQTTEGLRTLRNIQVELMTIDAELRGVEARSQSLAEWLKLNGDSL